jgi:hypothetical protein
MFLYTLYLLYVLYCIIIIRVGLLYIYIYVDIYLCICVLNALYIIYLYLILLQIFNKWHTKFSDIFSLIFIFSTFPRLHQVKSTGKRSNRPNFRIYVKTTTVEPKKKSCWLAGFDLHNFEIEFGTEN